MKQAPTREMVLDALQTHKTVQKAANALGIKYPAMQKYLRQYGIAVNRNKKEDYNGPVSEAKVSLFSRLAYRFKGGKV